MKDQREKAFFRKKGENRVFGHMEVYMPALAKNSLQNDVEEKRSFFDFSRNNHSKNVEMLDFAKFSKMHRIK